MTNPTTPLKWNPLNGAPLPTRSPHYAHDYRGAGQIWCYHPLTGDHRDTTAVADDPHGHWIIPTRAQFEADWRVTPSAPVADVVNHPNHYGGADNTYEAIKVIEAWGLGFCLGNTVKYISRAGKKDDIVQDLKKARWYLDREITNLEKRNA